MDWLRQVDQLRSVVQEGVKEFSNVALNEVRTGVQAVQQQSAQQQYDGDGATDGADPGAGAAGATSKYDSFVSSQAPSAEGVVAAPREGESSSGAKAARIVSSPLNARSSVGKPLKTTGAASVLASSTTDAQGLTRILKATPGAEGGAAEDAAAAGGTGMASVGSGEAPSYAFNTRSRTARTAEALGMSDATPGGASSSGSAPPPAGTTPASGSSTASAGAGAATSAGPDTDADLRKGYADMKKAYEDMKSLLKKSMDECVRLSEEVVRVEATSRQVAETAELEAVRTELASTAEAQAALAAAEAERSSRAEAQGTSEALRLESERRARVFNNAVKAAVGKAQLRAAHRSLEEAREEMRQREAAERAASEVSSAMKRVEELEAELGQLRTSLGAGGGKGALAGLSLFQLPTKEDVLAGLGLEMWKDDRLRWKSEDVETPTPTAPRPRPRPAADKAGAGGAKSNVAGHISLRVWLIIGYLLVLHIAVMVSFTRNAPDVAALCATSAAELKAVAEHKVLPSL
eukprot:XP_001690957.1 predicted protein [Chlamydomonas reinhardtii]